MTKPDSRERSLNMQVWVDVRKVARAVEGLAELGFTANRYSKIVNYLLDSFNRARGLDDRFLTVEEAAVFLERNGFSMSQLARTSNFLKAANQDAIEQAFLEDSLEPPPAPLNETADEKLLRTVTRLRDEGLAEEKIQAYVDAMVADDIEINESKPTTVEEIAERYR